MSDTSWRRRIKVVTLTTSDGADKRGVEFVVHTDFPLERAFEEKPIHMGGLSGVLKRVLDHGAESIVVAKYSVRVTVGYFFEAELLVEAVIRAIEDHYLKPTFNLVINDETTHARTYQKAHQLNIP